MKLPFNIVEVAVKYFDLDNNFATISGAITFPHTIPPVRSNPAEIRLFSAFLKTDKALVTTAVNTLTTEKIKNIRVFQMYAGTVNK